MSFLSRLLGKRSSDREAMRCLWDKVVGIARNPKWYASLDVADSKEGRFDMITVVLALVLLRIERDDPSGEATARLTELFVEDMDGQLRQSGIGDPTVGKHVRKLVTTLGGRLGALREALPLGEPAVVPVMERNVTTIAGCDHAELARAVLDVEAVLARTTSEALLAGEFDWQPR